MSNAVTVLVLIQLLSMAYNSLSTTVPVSLLTHTGSPEEGDKLLGEDELLGVMIT